MTPSILKEIVDQKQLEVNLLYEYIKQEPLSVLNQFFNKEKIRRSTKSFKNALNSANLSVIAEIKRRSPSKGELAKIDNPVILAHEYQRGGAQAISVLTDTTFFGGFATDLERVAQAMQNTNCAILRKDFIIDFIQISEAIVMGADAVLLIVSILKEKTRAFIEFAKSLNIEPLIEVHNQEELFLALDAGAEIIGINHRNLHDFSVNTDESLALVKQIPKSTVKIAESGIHSIDEAQRFADMGFNAVLIGEWLVKVNNPRDIIKSLRKIHLRKENY